MTSLAATSASSIRTSTRNVLAAVHDAIISQTSSGSSFYIADLSKVVSQLDRWREELPRVKPFYAVKSNSDPAILSTLAAHGTGFDCASSREISSVLATGVDPSRVIFAHPCKHPGHVHHASSVGVNLTTFDNIDELHKVASIDPHCQLVLRVRTDDAGAQCQLSNKFGADIEHAPFLLRAARDLGLVVRGVSFHVGSGNKDPEAFADALRNARSVFDMAAAMGQPMDLLDIGGGFPGLGTDSSAPQAMPYADKNTSFSSIAAVIRRTLAVLFPESSGVQIIAEPGRYFCEGAYTLCASILARRVPVPSAVQRQSSSVPGSDFSYAVGTASTTPALGLVTDVDAASAWADPMSAGIRSLTGDMSAPLPGPPMPVRYYINDSMYGSFNNIMFDHAAVHPIPLPSALATKHRLPLLEAHVEAWRAFYTPINPVALPPSEAESGAMVAAAADSAAAAAAASASDSDSSHSDLAHSCELARATPSELVDIAQYGPGATDMVNCSVWGQTCDGIDLIIPNANFPSLDRGDWFLFENMGSYTVAAASTFNGFDAPEIFYLDCDELSSAQDDLRITE